MTCLVRLTSNSSWKTLNWDADRHTDLSPIYGCYTSLMHAWYTVHIVLTRMHAHHTDTISVYPPEHLELVKAMSSMAMSPYGPFPRTPSNTTCRGHKGKPLKSLLLWQKASYLWNKQNATATRDRLHLNGTDVSHTSQKLSGKQQEENSSVQDMYALRKAHICCIQELLQRQHWRDFWEIGCLSHRSSSNAAFEAAPVFARLAIVLWRWITKYSFLHLSPPDEQWC